MNERWQYKVLDVSANLAGRPGEKVEETLNQLGEEGWELVSALRATIQPVSGYRMATWFREWLL